MKGCKSCAHRRASLMAKKAEKAAKKKALQAAAIGVVLTVTEIAGKALGIHGEVEDGSGTDGGPEPDSGSAGVSG